MENKCYTDEEEQYIKDIYAQCIREKPTFSEEMQETIRQELKKMEQEYIDYLKKKQEEEESNKII